MSRIGFYYFEKASSFDRVAAVVAASKDGYECGLNWRDEWEGKPEEASRWHPGGPWVYYDGRHPEYSAQSKKENEAWKRGWRDGHKEKHARRADLSKGWDDRGGIGEGQL
jgi:hypothetical protein